MALLLMATQAAAAAPADPDRCMWREAAVRLARSLDGVTNPRAEKLRAALAGQGITPTTDPLADCRPPAAAEHDGGASAGGDGAGEDTDGRTEAPVQQENSRALRIMPLGSSSTLGKGSDSNGGYRAPLYELLNRAGTRVDFVGSLSDGPDELPDKDHEGHSGWCVSNPCYEGRMDTGIAEHLDDWLTSTQPDVILLYAGGNDMSAGASGTEVAQRTDDLLSRAFELLPDVHVVVGLLFSKNDPEKDEQVRAFNSAVPAVAQQHNAAGHSVSLVDLYSLIGETDFSDETHLNEQGYQKMAEAWMQELATIVDGGNEPGRVGGS
jgi:acyl-CoA thioesterase I